MQHIQFVSKNIHSIFNYTFNRRLKSSNFYCNNVCKKRLLDVGMLFAFVRALRCDEVIEVDHMDWIFLVGSLHLFVRSFTKRWRLSVSLLLCLSLFLSVYLFVRSRFLEHFSFWKCCQLRRSLQSQSNGWLPLAGNTSFLLLEESVPFVYFLHFWWTHLKPQN